MLVTRGGNKLNWFEGTSVISIGFRQKKQILICKENIAENMENKATVNDYKALNWTSNQWNLTIKRGKKVNNGRWIFYSWRNLTNNQRLKESDEEKWKQKDWLSVMYYVGSLGCWWLWTVRSWSSDNPMTYHTYNRNQQKENALPYKATKQRKKERNERRSETEITQVCKAKKGFSNEMEKKVRLGRFLYTKRVGALPLFPWKLHFYCPRFHCCFHKPLFLAILLSD